MITHFYFRKRFSIKVNCWFCNTNLRVPYNDWNSFVCACCQQYNGFTEDGDYNKELSAQHYSKFNTNSFCQKANEEKLKLPASNGFCEFCSRNQEIKVLQLANFRPRCEAKYDEEIEEFKQKLEDSYQLCQQCQRHLNKTLNRVKTRFISSKITQLFAKNLKDLNQTAKIIKDDGKFFSTMIMTSILLLSIGNFIRDMKIEMPSFEHSDKIQLAYNHLRAFIFTIGYLLTKWMRNLELTEIFDDVNIDKIAMSAVALNFILILDNLKRTKTQVIVSILMWAVKMILNEISIDDKYVLTVQGTIAVILIVSSVCMFKKPKKERLDMTNKNGSFHKICTELIDESDTELDVSDVNSSFFDVQSTRSSIYSKPSKLNTSFRSSFAAPTVKSFNSTIRNFSHPAELVSNKSFSITKEVMAADRKQLQHDITSLSNKLEAPIFSNTCTIRDFNSSHLSNPFSVVEKSRCGSPTPSVASIFSVSNRGQLISPPRLHSPMVYSSNATPSWIAGGYWTSPQKKYLNAAALQSKPIMSRSSSQSSGLGTIEDGEKNSSENSLSQEDAPSIFSDAVSQRKSLFDKPINQARSLFNETSSSFNPSRHHNFYNNTHAFSSNNNNFGKYRENFYK